MSKNVSPYDNLDEREKILLERMSDIMKTNLDESLSDFKKLIASEIAGISKKSEDQITKLKKDMTTRFKTLENSVATQKSTTDRIPKIEETVQRITGVLTDDACKNLKTVTETTPRLSALETKMDEIQTGYDKVEKSLGYHVEDVTANKTEIEKLNGLVRAQQKAIERLINDNRKIKKKFENLQELVNSIDNRQRKYNLIFEGVNEGEKENTKQVVTKLITDAVTGCDTSNIDSAYRLGKKVGSKSRPIMITFANLTTKDLILLKANEIKKKSENSTLWINKDLSDASRIRSMEVRKCYNLMRKHKHKCQLVGSTIHFDFKVFEHKDLHKLPSGCTLEDTQLVVLEDKTSLCFQGSHAYVSNFYATEIEYMECLFTSSEQAFQWQKAIENNDHEAARAILETDDPYTIKKLGEGVTAAGSWVEREETILRGIVKQKFLQNEELYDRFTSSPYTSFYECTVGNKWGCGSKLNLIDLDPAILQGKNKFGEILNSLKKEFMESERAGE